MAKDDLSWNFAFLFHSIAFGMLPTLVILYFVDYLGGSLFNFGLMSASAILFRMGTSIFAGRLPERYGRAKPFILSSFLFTSIILFALSYVKSILLFQALYVLLEVSNSIYSPSKQILIAEIHQRADWNQILARHNLIIGLGGTTGLALCSLLVSSVGYRGLLLLCAPLVFISFLISFVVIQDPAFYVERWLSRISRPINDVETLSYRLGSMKSVKQFRLNPTINMTVFGLGTFVFTIASSSALSSLPIFFNTILLLTPTLVFAILMLRSLFGAFSYVLIGRWSNLWRDGTAIKMASFARTVLILCLPSLTVLPPLAPIGVVILLSAVEFSWSLYSVDRSTIIMDYSSERSLGVHEALRQLGRVVGSLLSGLILELFSFNQLFILASGLFLISFLIFWKSIA